MILKQTIKYTETKHEIKRSNLKRCLRDQSLAFLFSCCRSIWQREKTFLLRNVLFKERLESGFKRRPKGAEMKGAEEPRTAEQGFRRPVQTSLCTVQTFGRPRDDSPASLLSLFLTSTGSRSRVTPSAQAIWLCDLRPRWAWLPPPLATRQSRWQ